MQITGGKASSKGLQPYIQVDSGSLGIPTVALIDTGADTNTISYALWEKLGKPYLTTHQLILTGFAEQEVHMLGKCNLPVYIFGYKCTHEFFVFPKNVSSTQMIMGEPWQRAFQCTLKWHKEAVKIVVRKKRF